ncbi:MAG: lysophospholipid acyltransferase family protein [Planctomycetaceae bacterium]
MKIRSRFVTRILARLAVWVLKLLFWTCRKEVHLEQEGINPLEGTGDERFLYSIWHDQILMTLFTGRAQNVGGLVSRHQDGSYVSDAMEMVGIKPVRGSTNRGGAQALRQLMEAAQKLHIAITPDGPRGPRHELKSGIVFLASRTGRRIIPVAHGCRRCWNIQGSWTDMMIPKPFTRIFAIGGKPIEVPAELDREGIERYTAIVQAEMNRLEQKMQRIKAGESEPVQQEQKLAA